MSLDVYLTLPGTQRAADERIFIREGGQNKELTRDEWDARFPGQEPFVALSSDSNEAYTANITHNLVVMAKYAGIYQVLWRPEELGITHAVQLIAPLSAGLTLLKIDPGRFSSFNPSNGWGTYEGLVEFVEEYLAACIAHPTAEVSVSR